MTHPRPRLQLSDVPLDPNAFEAEAAALAMLANLKAAGPATARDLVSRIEEAARVAGEGELPFKHATIYALLHELEFQGAIVAGPARERERKIYAIATRGRQFLALARERWRTAILVIDAAAAVREEVHL